MLQVNPSIRIYGPLYIYIIKLYFRLLVCPVPVFPVYPIDPTLFLKAGEEALHPVPETLEDV